MALELAGDAVVATNGLNYGILDTYLGLFSALVATRKRSPGV